MQDLFSNILSGRLAAFRSSFDDQLCLPSWLIASLATYHGYLQGNGMSETSRKSAPGSQSTSKAKLTLVPLEPRLQASGMGATVRQCHPRIFFKGDWNNIRCELRT